MRKKEFLTRVSEVLRENSVRKPITIPEHSFHIKDSDGNSALFKVKSEDKTVAYNFDDVDKIVDGCIAVIVDAIQHGEEIIFRDFGTLGLNRRAARRTKKVGEDVWVEVPARYVPKFRYGNQLRLAAKAYEMNLEEDERHAPPEPVYDPEYE